MFPSGASCLPVVCYLVNVALLNSDQTVVPVQSGPHHQLIESHDITENGSFIDVKQQLLSHSSIICDDIIDNLNNVYT